MASCTTRTGKVGVYERNERQDDRILPFEVKNEATSFKDTRTSERVDGETQSDHIENYKGDGPPRTPVIL